MPIFSKFFWSRHLPHAVLAVAACSSTGALAQVGDATRGATLYVQRMNVSGAQASCQDCHGFAGTFRDSRFPGATEATIRAGIQGAINSNDGMVMGAYTVWTAQQISDVAAHLQAAITPPPPPPFAPLPTPAASPASVMFGATAVGATSATQTVLLSNSASTAITLGNPFVGTGTGQTGDFKAASVPAGQTACINGGLLEPGASCLIGVQFAPTAAGDRTATWSINFVGNVSARSVPLQGTATGAAAGGTSPAPTGSANAPSNAGAGALGWLSLLGLFSLLGIAGTRRR
jgi:mono/diheme cytochrome c family protein